MEFVLPQSSNPVVGLLDYWENPNHYYFGHIVITIIQTIIFEFENMLYLFSMSLRFIFL